MSQLAIYVDINAKLFNIKNFVTDSLLFSFSLP